MVHSQKHLVIFVQKDFTTKHSNAINSINIIMNCGAHSAQILQTAQQAGSITKGVIKIFH